MDLPGWIKDIEIIDTHVHVIDLQKLKYDVVEFTTSPFLSKNWSENMYREDLGEIPVRKIIFEETNASKDYMLKEVEWVHDTYIKDPNSMFTAIVANVPVERGKIAVIEWLNSLKPYTHITAARRLIQDMPVGFCTSSDFIEGVKAVASQGLVFDICIRAGAVPQQMRDVITLVRKIPEGTFVLDHIGKPDIAANNFDEWSEFITELACFKNVFCKISGVVTEAGSDWTIESIRPFVEHCLKRFGYERCMFGSDWFICNINASLKRWILACAIVDVATLQEKRALFCNTARKVYKIASPNKL
jgi:L-fuconolactonase